jgi:hypothetical protein
MKKAMGLLLLAGTATLAPAATLIRCVDANGKVTFSDRACEGRQRESTVEVRPNVVDTKELRDWNDKTRRRSPVYQYDDDATAPASYSAPAARQRDPIACENARRMYDFEMGKRKNQRDYTALSYRRNEVRSACGS